jgi:hypothetical protein
MWLGAVGDSGETLGDHVHLFIKLTIEAKMSRSRDIVEKSDIAFIKLPTQKLHCIPSYPFGDEESGVEADE